MNVLKVWEVKGNINVFILNEQKKSELQMPDQNSK